MKVWDRHTAASVDLPEEVEPGRYKLLSRCVLNGHTQLDAGDILWSDGAVRCNLSGDQVARIFQQEQRNSSTQSEDLIDEAVAAVADQLGAYTLPSPIMPIRLEKHIEMLDLENLLEDVLRKGHLQAISARPRQDMRYDAEVLPVSRARRLAADALTRLASNSADWNRRTISGIVPLRLSSLVSEDEFVIYENLVFARLLDLLADKLRRRMSKVRRLLQKIQQAASLSNAQHLHQRLRHDICSLWGQSFADDSSAGERARDTYDRLKSLYGKVMHLQRRGLYLIIPNSRQISKELRNTNILQHDPHYRNLRPLWVRANSGLARTLRSPSQKYEAARLGGERYAQFIHLLVRRALVDSHLLNWQPESESATFGPWHLHVRAENGESRLTLKERRTGQEDQLVFVAGWRGRGSWDSQLENHYVVFCHDVDGQDDETGERCVLHPLQFYCVERVRLVIEKWLLKRMLGLYPFVVSPVPAALQTEVTSRSDRRIRADGTRLVLESPLPAEIEARVRDAINQGNANSETKGRLLDAISLVQQLAACRVCGHQMHPSHFHGSHNGFKAGCPECGATWSLRLANGRPVDGFCRLGKDSRPFEEVGSREMVLHW